MQSLLYADVGGKSDGTTRTARGSVMPRRRSSTRLVLWGGRSGDVQFGSAADAQRERSLAMRRSFLRFATVAFEVHAQILDARIEAGQAMLKFFKEAGLLES